MSRVFPAIEIHFDASEHDDALALVLAEIDEFAPASVDDHGVTRIFFTTCEQRDQALQKLQGGVTPGSDPTAIDVPDEHWAERSQAALRAVRAGHLVIAPPWDASPGAIVIQPSMGFGTGHHATTRLCLRLLQEAPVTGASVL